MPTVQRKRPSKKPGGRLPDRPDFGGCPPGFHRPPATRLPFAELYPFIPNLTPIPGTDGALNNAALTVSALGVIYILEAWFQQAENDFVWVELNGLEVKSYTVSETDAAIGKDITLNIESVRFIDQAFNKLQGFVRRLNGTIEETTLLDIWVDTKAPGGLDPQTSTPTINENLARPRFEDPTIEAFGIITQAAAQLGIKVIIDDYPVNPLVDQVYHRKEADVIFISIGGVIVTHTVTSFEASGDAPIIITINYGTWLQVTPGVNILEWFVRDKAGNQSHGFSMPRLIQSNVGGGVGPLLPEGLVPESEYDADLDEDFIDTDTQSSDLSFEVPIRNYAWAANDKVLVTYLGLTSTGEPLKHTETANVPQPNALRIYVPLPLTFAKKLAGGRLLITYERVRVGAANTPSNAVIYSMRGVPADNSRPAPIVKGVQGGVLPVDTDPVEITVRFFEQDPGDKVDLIIEGKALDGTPVYAKYTEIAGTGDIDFYLDYFSVFSALEGSSFTAYYVVNNDTARPSKSVTVQVGDIQVTLPPPTSAEAPPPDHVFNELVSKGNLKALVHPHSSIALNDEVRLVANGSKPSGSITTSWLKVTSTWFGADLPFTIPRAIVLANKEGTMTLHWEVRTLPTDTPLKSLPLVVNVGAMLQITECPSLLESTYVSPCVTQLNPQNVWTPSPRIVTFRAKYLMLPTDLVKLVVQNKLGPGMPDIPSRPGVPDAGHDYITFSWNSNFVATYLGESFTVHFEVQRNGNIIESPKLTVNVDALSEQARDLVSVPEASGGVIDTSLANHVEIKAWPFFAKDQSVFIDLKGPPDHPQRTGKVVSAAEFTAKHTSDLIDRDYWSGFDNGANMTVHARVSLDGFNNKDTAIALKPMPYVIQRKAQIIKTILVGDNPSQIVITPDGKKLFVMNHGSISVIDTLQQKVVHTIVTSSLQGIAISNDGTRLFGANAGALGQGVYNYIFSTDTYGILGWNYNDYWALSAASNKNDSKVYYGDYSASHFGIAIFNSPGNTFSKRIILSRPLYPYSIKPDPDGAIALIVNRNSTYPYMQRIDLRTDTLIGNTPGFSGPVNDVAFEAEGTRAVCATTNQVSMMDYHTNIVVGSLPGFTSVQRVACHPHLKRAYVSDNTVKVLDTSGTTPVLVDTLSFPSPAFALLVSPDGQYLYVTSPNADLITIVKL
ncbi:YncE family protein [Pseudomonas nabeulensis]|uniref:YncE family protein n=2 Tax=Pseudomonas nabeulensis TaxID=2293833 RepID=A0A4Z0BAJ9_9PSED|nr:YncE family protein [Pseudomonas nabeulensis]